MLLETPVGSYRVSGPIPPAPARSRSPTSASDRGGPCRRCRDLRERRSCFCRRGRGSRCRTVAEARGDGSIGIREWAVEHVEEFLAVLVGEDPQLFAQPSTTPRSRMTAVFSMPSVLAPFVFGIPQSLYLFGREQLLNVVRAELDALTFLLEVFPEGELAP